MEISSILTICDKNSGENIENIDFYIKTNKKGGKSRHKYTEIENMLITTLLEKNFDRISTAKELNFRENDLSRILSKPHIQDKINLLITSKDVSNEFVKAKKEGKDLKTVDDYIKALSDKKFQWLNELEEIASTNTDDFERDSDRVRMKDVKIKAIRALFDMSEKLEESARKLSDNKTFEVVNSEGNIDTYTTKDIVNEIMSETAKNTDVGSLEK